MRAVFILIDITFFSADDRSLHHFFATDTRVKNSPDHYVGQLPHAAFQNLAAYIEWTFVSGNLQADFRSGLARGKKFRVMRTVFELVDVAFFAADHITLHHFFAADSRMQNSGNKNVG